VWLPAAGLAAAATSVERGRYLVEVLGAGGNCHTPMRADLTPDHDRLAAGGLTFQGPWGVSHAANLTPAPDTAR
jgi:hypothetical protein